MCLFERGQGWGGCEEGFDRFGGKLEDETALGDVAHVVFVKSGDGIIEVDGVKKCDGSAGFDEADGFVWFTAGHEDEKHGDDCGGALHAGVAMDENGMAGVIGGGDSVDGLERPEACVADLLGLEVVVEGNTEFGHGRIKNERDIFCTVEDGVDAVALKPVGSGCGLMVAEPETWNNFVCPCFHGM
jgi:hypothetical protein